MLAQDARQDQSRPDRHADNPRIPRIITACLRCRQKKIKCDREFPKCDNCKKVGSDCVLLDPDSGEQVSRSRISGLSEELERVKKELSELKKRSQAVPSPAPQVAESAFGKLSLNLGDDYVPVDVATAPLPERSFAEACVVSFFQQTNAHTPLVHRDYFLFNHFKPLYETVGVDFLKKIFGPNFDAESYAEEPYDMSSVTPRLRGKSLFFLHIIIAISTSQYQQKFPLELSSFHKKQAFGFLHHIYQTQDEDHKHSIPKMEMLQALLLLAQYSLMRPCTPGAWYLTGTCVRLCQDLGCNNETSTNEEDLFGIDFRRRVFWCAFLIDKQVSIYFGRQSGFDSRQIRCPLFSLGDDSTVVCEHMNMSTMRNHLWKEPQVKLLAMRFVSLRGLQGEIFDYIHDNAHRVTYSAPRPDPATVERMYQHDLWKSRKHEQLLAWMRESQSDETDNNQFNSIVYRLNFNQTLIHLYGISPITPVITNLEHHRLLYSAGRDIILLYAEKVKQELVNYSWVAVNNLYMGAIVMLLSISQSPELLRTVSIEVVRQDSKLVVMLLEEFYKICFDTSRSYVAKFQDHSKMVINQLEQTQGLHGPAQEMMGFDDKALAGEYESLEPDQAEKDMGMNGLMKNVSFRDSGDLRLEEFPNFDGGYLYDQ